MITIRFGLIVLIAALLAGIVALIVFDISLDILSASAQSPNMGPYDIAVLPLEDVPESFESVVRRPIVSYSGEYATAEVLRVLKDPRTIPLERFIYYKHPSSGIPQNRVGADPEVFEERLQLYDVITHPDADRIIERFSYEVPGAVAVYVRTVGHSFEREYFDEEGNTYSETLHSIDPFYVRDPIRDYDHLTIWADGEPAIFDAWFPWPIISVADPESDLSFPCMPNQVFEFSDPYKTPGTNSEFDPASYLPPKPWYSASNYLIKEGEIREVWLLCLAPDIPVEEVEIVRRYHYAGTPGLEFFTSPSEIVWANLDMLQMGEWRLLSDQQVIAWNDGTDNRVDEPERLDQTVVFEGDVWMSLSTALHYDQVQKRHSSELKPLNTVLFQFYFEGMDTLLQEWDHLALSETVLFSFCKDDQLFDCTQYADDGSYSFLSISEITARGTWGQAPYATEDIQTFIALPIMIDRETGDIDADRSLDGRIQAWTVTPQNVDMPLLTTHEICEQTECIPEDSLYAFSAGKPMEPEDFPTFDGPIPIIPYGESAYGIQIIGVNELKLHVSESGLYPLDLILAGVYIRGIYRVEETDDYFLKISSDGTYQLTNIYYFDGVYFQWRGGAEGIYYPNNGRWPGYRYEWLTQIINGSLSIGLFFDIPENASLDYVYLMLEAIPGGTGPAYKIQYHSLCINETSPFLT